MHVIDLLAPERIAVRAAARSKKRALELASELLTEGHPELNARNVFSCLVSRERLGSTGFGGGVALPHGRLEHSDTVSGAFLHLNEPVDFDAIDRQGVDLLFALVVPSHCEERHLALLAQLAELFNDPDRRQAMRAAHSPREVLQLLQAWQTQQAE